MGRQFGLPLHILSFSCVIVVTVHNTFIIALLSRLLVRGALLSPFHLLNVSDCGPLSPAVTDDEDKGAYLPPFPDMEQFI